LLALLLAGASLAAHTWYFKPLSIDWFYARVFLRLALENPELLTQLRILEPIGIRSHNARLTDASIAHEDRVRALAREEFEHWRFHNYPVNPLFGPSGLDAQQVRFDDATYIARLGEIPRKLDQVIDGLRVREQKGLIPPKFVVEKVIDQVNAFVAPGAQGNALTVGFREKLEKTSIDETARAGLLAHAEQAAGASVIPAYRRLEMSARCASSSIPGVLKNGALPLALLERVIDAYVARRKAT
jgi:uncharacterized protein (DUF885 family)